MLTDIFTTLGRQLRPAFSMLIVLSVLTGLIYPSAITLAAKVLFPHQARGSLIEEKGTVIGSELIGQQFTAPGLFWGRPSATSPQPYNAQASSGSNLAPAGEAQLKAVAERVAALRAANQLDAPGNAQPIPADLVTASASGLDPHISPEAALWQVPRVAHARGLKEASLGALVARHTEARQLGILGEPRVNVLLLNRALDSLAASAENTRTRP
jgi:potassium-transporting ATPase KdpC subunit